MSTIRMRAMLDGDVCEVRSLIQHDMETGRRQDPDTGQTVPAHFIQRIWAEHNGRTVMNAYWGPGVSANPLFNFRFSGAASGDTVTLSWVDSEGQEDSASTNIR